jgi:hypothetical protein
MTDQQIDIVYNRLGDIDPEYAESFINSEDKDKWLIDNEDMLEGTTAYVDSYKNLADLKGDRLEALSKFWMERRGKKLSEDRLEQFIYDHPDIYGEEPDMESAKKDVRDYFAKADDYYDQFKTSRQEEAARIRRQQEVEGKLIGEDAKKNWPWWKKAITSDYEKERYIHDPKSALFGSEAPALGEAEDTRWGSMADLGLGTVGNVADFVPPLKMTVPGLIATALAGPAIRTLRDAGHKWTDSPYQKDWTQIAAARGTDAAINASTIFLPNFRRVERGAMNVVGPAAERSLRVDRGIASVNEGLDLMKSAPSLDNPIAFRRYIEDLPESELKNSLLGATNDFTKGIDANKVTKILNDYDSGINVWRERNALMAQKYGTVASEPQTNLAKEALLVDVKPLTTGEKVQKAIARGAESFNKGTAGQIVKNAGFTAAGAREPGAVNIVEEALAHQPEYQFKTADPNDEVLLRMWKAGFTPGKNDPLYDDYQEWKRQEEEKKK